MGIKSRKLIEWSPGIKTGLCLTFDLDAESMWNSEDPANAQRPTIVSQGRFDVEEGLANVLDFLDYNGIQTTFFVPSSTVNAHTDAIREVVLRGHEVGCHGTDHVPILNPAPDVERKMLGQATDELQTILGIRPVGYRAPLMGVTPDTWGILADLGYEYSSNLMDTVHPYLHPNRLVEIPTHWSLDDGLYFLSSFFPPNYWQPASPSAVTDAWVSELEGIARMGGVTTLVLHPQLIARPGRLRILQDVVDAARNIESVCFLRLRDLAQLTLRSAEATRTA